MKARFCPSSDNYFVKNADCFASRRYSLKNKLGDWMIKQYWTWSSQNIMICQYLADQYNYHFICLSLWLWQIINLLTTDFAQPRPIIVNSQSWEGEKNYSEVEKLVEKAWNEKSFIFSLLFPWSLTSIVFVTGYKENSLQATVFLQMSMKFKGSSLLSSYIPYYNGFIKTTRK